MATQTKTDPIETATAKVAEFNEKADRERQEGQRRLPRLLREGRRPVRRRLREGRRRDPHRVAVDGRRHAGRLHPRDHQGVHERRARARRSLVRPPHSPSLRDDSEPRRPAWAPRLSPLSGDERLVDLDQRRAAASRSDPGPRGSRPPRPTPRTSPPGRGRWRLSVSADISRLSAIASTTRSDGSRNPRSICDRYGFEIPTRSASWRIVSSCSSRWWRMNCPNVESSSVSATRQVYATDSC